MTKIKVYFFLLSIFSSFFSFSSAITDSLSVYRLYKSASNGLHDLSGDFQFQTAGLKTERPLNVMVLDKDSLPVPYFPVYFEIVSFPQGAENFRIYDTVVNTDKNGIASTYINMGTKEGEYEVSAKIRGNSDRNWVVFKLYARDSAWMFMLIVGLIGGLCLFLMGMNMMSEGLQKSSGDKMRMLLGVLTNNRIAGIGAGAFISVMIQSSSATTVMLVSFVHSGLMRFSQTLAVILGAAAGTTITVQLFAFRFSGYSLIFVVAGFVMRFLFKTEKIKNIGEAVLGFGLLFFGMHFMSESMLPLRSYDPFIGWLVGLENPLLAIFIGAVFTALLQSSAAFMGIIILLGAQGFLSLEAGIALILGANLGTCFTALLSAFNTTRDAKKVALAHTLLRIAGLILFVWWIPSFADLIRSISPHAAQGLDHINARAVEIPRQIANAHSFFNVAMMLALLPFTRIFAKLVHKILPYHPKDSDPFTLRYINEQMLNTPVLALNLAKQEAVRMGKTMQEMVKDSILMFISKDKNIQDKIQKKEKEVDFLRDNIKNYLVKITRLNIPGERIQEAFQIMYAIKEFEQIADIVATNLHQQAQKWIGSGNEFSEEGKREIAEYHNKAVQQVSLAIEVFSELNLTKARYMKLKYNQYRQLANELERQHYQRLVDDVEKSITSSKTHIEVLSMLKFISRHATNVARIILEQQPGKSKKNKRMS